MEKSCRHTGSVSELSGGAGPDSEASEALWSLFFLHLAIFRFAAGKTVAPVANDEKQSKSVVDAGAIERPA